MQISKVQLHKNIARALADEELNDALAGVKHNFVGKRAKAVDAYNAQGDFEALRDHAKQVRDYGVAHLPRLLREFDENATQAGATVLWARDGARACEIIRDIAARHGVTRAVKSKSMASEEVALNDALAAAGVTVVETDLGEYIIQLSGETPSHIIAPAVHKSRQAVSDLFKQHLAVDTGDIGELTAAARARLRDEFLAADMGISGANFLVADNGASVIVTNEGNGRMVTTLPRVQVVLAGIDKIIPRAADLPYLLPLLTQSATGQRLSNYVSMTRGKRGGGKRGGGGEGGSDSEGAAHVYIVLLDNGRSRLRHSEYREMLRCIRCGACMNHCPVYHSIGGHAYGSVYMGPMGQVLTPALRGVEQAGALPYAATLCGACAVVCPVKIPLPTLMRRLRAEQVRKNLSAPLDRMFIRVWAWCARRPRVYALLTAAVARLGAWIGGRRGIIRRLPGLGGWFNGRDLPAPPPRTFRQLWRDMERVERQK